MNKYEQLKKIIQQANPEIMELKFGCAVKVKIGVFISKYGREDNVKTFTVISSTKESILVSSEYDLSRDIKRESVVRILGRPIRLADVLLAIKERFKYDSTYAPETTSILELTSPKYNHGVFIRYGLWNLRDDNLDHQSEETKQSLIDLLV